MTERTGGSDVSRTETLARRDTSSRYVYCLLYVCVLQFETKYTTRSDVRAYELFGYKYFTSSINSQLAFGLARIVDVRCHKQRLLTLLSMTHCRLARLHSLMAMRLLEVVACRFFTSKPETKMAGRSFFDGLCATHKLCLCSLNNIVVHKLKDKLGTRVCCVCVCVYFSIVY
jgi:hypothetical protein